jgi:hypothetical protein
MLIPSNVEISKLIHIESILIHARHTKGTESISWIITSVIPQNVRFINGSAFIDVTLSSISIESGNEIFVLENGFLIDVLHHKLIRNIGGSSQSVLQKLGFIPRAW